MKRCLTARKSVSPAVIDMAPLIDMVFLLLVFYIVSASFTQDNAVNIQRPQSRNATAVAEPHLAVAISKNGTVYVAGRPAANDRRAEIARGLRNCANPRVLIYADRAVPTGTLLAVMDDCHAAGAEKVDVAAVKK